MKIKELIKQLQLLNNKEAEIYLCKELELYKPIIQAIYDSEKDENYYLLVK